MAAVFLVRAPPLASPNISRRKLRVISSAAHAPALQAPTSPSVIRTKFRYVRRPEEQLWVKLADKSTNMQDVDVFVDVADARPLFGRSGIDVEGFEIHVAPSQVASWDDDEAVKEVYYPEAMALAKAVSGAKVARVMKGHTFRRVDLCPAEGRPRADQTADKVHTDFTPESAAMFLYATFGENVAKKCGRYGIINLWRPVVDVVYDCPLGFMDARSLKIEDTAPCSAIGPEFTAKFQVGVQGGELHQKWYYVPRQTSAEVLAFKQFDSDASKVQWVLHTGFQDPTAPVEGGFKPRESVEIRIFVLYDVDEKQVAELQAAGASSAYSMP